LIKGYYKKDIGTFIRGKSFDEIEKNINFEQQDDVHI
jgi:hypothetical protein